MITATVRFSAMKCTMSVQVEDVSLEDTLAVFRDKLQKAGVKAYGSWVTDLGSRSLTYGNGIPVESDTSFKAALLAGGVFNG